jgi:hypothetical protein
MERDIKETARILCQNVHDILDNVDKESFEPKPIPIERLKNWVRETYQDITLDHAKILVEKLKTNEPLTKEDQVLLENWMIGDLSMYKKMEPHFVQWKKEIRRLCNELTLLTTKNITSNPQLLLALQGLLLEFEHVLKDVEHYKYILDRIHRYELFVGFQTVSLDAQRRFQLAEQLREMIYSPLK